MPESLVQILYQLRESWNKLPRQAKIIIPTVAVVLLVALIAMSFWSGSEAYTILFSNLSDRDLGLIEAELTRTKFVYQSQGGTISVPAGTESQARMALAMKNLPRAGDAYEIFKESNLGDTFLDFDRKYQQMTETKIRSAIESLAPVQFADVNITPMVDSPFAVDQKPAKAVVMLRLHPGKRLDYGQVLGITHLVASSVKSLSPEDVKVIDDQGRTLRTASPISEADLKIEGALKHRTEYQTQIAAAKARKIKALLAPLVGGDQYVQASVDVEADFDSQIREEIIYNPNELDTEEIPTESQIRINEKTKGPAYTGLPPGTASNVTTSAGIDLQNQTLEVERDSTEVRSLVSQRTVKTETVPGKITRLTATAIVDYKKEYQDEVLQYIDWTPEERLELEQVVKNAVGFDAARGDEVNVLTMKFDRTLQTGIEKQLAAAERQQMFKDVAKAVFIFAIGLIILLLLWRGLRTLRIGEGLALETGVGAENALPGATEGAELSTGTPEEKLAAAMKGDALSAFPREAAEDDMLTRETPESQEINRLQEEITNLVQSEPEAVALIIRNWLSETALDGGITMRSPDRSTES